MFSDNDGLLYIVMTVTPVVAPVVTPVVVSVAMSVLFVRVWKDSR